MAIKKEQIIIRLSPLQKRQLQEIADDLKIDMSKLVRDKIDEIIMENKNKINNKRIIDNTENFIKYNTSRLASSIITDEVVAEMKEEFKKIFIDKMKKEIEETNITENLNNK